MALGSRVASLYARLALAVFGFSSLSMLAGQPDRPVTHIYTVVIRNFKYEPDIATVSLGDTVVWKNADIVPHTVTAVDKSFDSGNVAPRHSWRWVAQKKGSFSYLCSLHPNMTAQIVVH